MLNRSDRWPRRCRGVADDAAESRVDVSLEDGRVRLPFRDATTGARSHDILAELQLVVGEAQQHLADATSRTVNLPFNADMKNGNALIETVVRGDMLYFCT